MDGSPNVDDSPPNLASKKRQQRSFSFDLFGAAMEHEDTIAPR